ncbi:MAG: hypothetical protein LBQ75_01415 [Zoogloeaceae bacterium]|jgi:hypothetical protein|nr:hypothetical protein [Zoogloeaceae bacterium]
MRPFIALAFCFLLASPQVHACHPFSYKTIFFKTIPDPPPDADVIAKVSLSDVKEATAITTATATVMQVLKASDARVYQGAKIALSVRPSNCGPDPRNGDEGIIIAKVDTDKKGRLVLCPYTYRNWDGHFSPQIMSSDADDSRNGKYLRDYGCPNGRLLYR